jgi:hypothetical protein
MTLKQRKMQRGPGRYRRSGKDRHAGGLYPITCATPIIMSEPLGFYEKYGLMHLW